MPDGHAARQVDRRVDEGGFKDSRFSYELIRATCYAPYGGAEMVALAEQRVAKYGERAHVFVGDVAVIAAPDASFDIVVDYDIIHHIPPWPQALHEIARVLRPGGSFYFEDLFRAFISAWPIRALFDHPQATQFTAAEFRTELEATGLSVCQWRELGTWGVMGCADK